MSLRDIVNVVITRQTTPVSRMGFGTILVVGEHALFADRVRYYTDPDQLLDDGFVIGDAIYKAVAAAFNQSPRPVRVGVGAKVVGDADWPTALNEIRDYNDEWYGLIITSRDPAVVAAVAAWTESKTKIFGTASDVADILDPEDDTDIASTLSEAGYTRTFVFYTDTPDQFPDAAWMGKQLPKDPGTETWKFKTLAGITPSEITDSEATAALDKNANLYQTIGGVSITREGTMSSGEFIDVIHGVDWLQARMTERVYSRLVNLPKVPYTDAGIAVVEAEIRAQLEDGVRVGFLAAETVNSEGKTVPGYSITVPKAGSVPANDKATRVLNDVRFDAVLAGAIHSLTIQGVVRV